MYSQYGILQILPYDVQAHLLIVMTLSFMLAEKFKNNGLKPGFGNRPVVTYAHLSQLVDRIA